MLQFIILGVASGMLIRVGVDYFLHKKQAKKNKADVNGNKKHTKSKRKNK